MDGELPPLRVRYQTFEFGDLDIHVCALRDTVEFVDVDGEAAALGISSAMWPLFGVVWDSGRALAALMADIELRGRRILEVGCGIGVASLVLAQRSADITATDRHPEAGRFLARNVALNGGAPVSFVRTGWADDDEDGLGSFDLIIGSDLLYEPGQAEDLAGFICRHARATCQVIVVDPRRGFASPLQRALEGMGFASGKRTIPAGGRSGATLQVLEFAR